MIINTQLSRYIGHVAITTANVYEDTEGNARINARWGQDREKFTYNGGNGDDIVLGENLPNDVSIEFEGTRVQNEKWIGVTAKNCERLKFQYCIADHGGTSEYIRVCNIRGLPKDARLRQQAKKLLAIKVIPKGADVDFSNFGVGLTPIVGQPHWKPKYHGAIHRMTFGINPLEQKNTYPKEWLKELKQPPKLNVTNVTDDDLSITQVVPTGGLKNKGNELQGSHPVHGSDTGSNFCVNHGNNCWHCFRCNSGGGPLSWIAVQEGIIECHEAVSGGLTGDKFKKTIASAVLKYGYGGNDG